MPEQFEGEGPVTKIDFLCLKIVKKWNKMWKILTIFTFIVLFEKYIQKLSETILEKSENVHNDFILFLLVFCSDLLWEK